MDTMVATKTSREQLRDLRAEEQALERTFSVAKGEGRDHVVLLIEDKLMRVRRRVLAIETDLSN